MGTGGQNRTDLTPDNTFPKWHFILPIDSIFTAPLSCHFNHSSWHTAIGTLLSSRPTNLTLSALLIALSTGYWGAPVFLLPKFRLLFASNLSRLLFVATIRLVPIAFIIQSLASIHVVVCCFSTCFLLVILTPKIHPVQSTILWTLPIH